MDARKRYEHDPAFRGLVDTLVAFLLTHKMDAWTAAEAVVLASQFYAERYQAPAVLKLERVD